MSRTDVVIFIMGAIALFLLIGYFRQYRTATKIRKDASEASKRQRLKRPLHHERLARFDRIIFDVISKRKHMSKEEHTFLLTSIPLLYSKDSEVQKSIEYIDSLYERYAEQEERSV